MTPLFALLFDSLDERLRLRRPARQVLNKVFPHHWSFLLGEVALFSFVVLVLTGIFLTMFYDPRVEPVLYTGSNEVYRGTEVPAAFESIVRLSYDVPGGLLFRRLHRGAAYVFIAGIVGHALRILLTGAFRRPREVNYHVGIILLMLALALVGTGQALPYDVIEGAALRIAYSFMLATPFIGEQLAFWVFGGDFFGDAIPRFYVAHILILPGAVAGLITAHLLILVRQRHTQFPRRGVNGQRYVLGKPLWPSQFVSSAALIAGIVAVLVAASVLVPWSDVAARGPAQPGVTSSSNHPDWWLSFAEGALVLYPAWEWYPLPGVVISAPFVAGVLLPGLVFAALFALPWLDRRLYPYDGDVHELQRPLDAPVRAGVVLAGLAFVVTLGIGSHSDFVSEFLDLTVEGVVRFFQAAVFAVPLLVFAVTVARGRTAARRRR